MKEKVPTGVDRRGLLRVMVTGATAAAAAATADCEADAAEPTARDEKRRARYQPDSAEIRDFYRVNGYPAGTRRSSC